MQNRGWNVFLSHWNDRLFNLSRRPLLASVCQLLTHIYIIFTVSGAGATQPTCEFEASKPVARFLRTLQSGVKEGVIPVAHLQWMIAQSGPTNPMRSNRRPENLEFKRSFARELPLLSGADWSFVMEQARGIEREVNDRHAQRQEAVSSTINVYNIVSADFEFPVGEHFVQLYVSSNGEPFILMSEHDQLQIYSIANGKKLTLGRQPHYGKFEFDFFETSQGKILFAVNSPESLRVIDLRSGQTIFDQTRAIAANPLSPLIYEEQGILSVILGLKENKLMERDALVPVKRIQFFPDQDKVSEENFVGPSRVVRLKDGHLYGHSLSGKTLTRSLGEMNIRLVDLTIGQELFSLNGVQGNPDNYSPALVFSSGPKLLMRAIGKPWSLVDPANRQLKPLIFENGLENARGFFNHGDRVLQARFSGLDRPPAKMLIKNILSGDETWIDVGLKDNRADTSSDPNGVMTSFATFAHVWELQFDQQVRLHLYNLDTGELNSLDVPKALQGRDFKLFYNGSDRRILMIGRPTGKPWQLLQVYGPERHQR